MTARTGISLDRHREIVAEKDQRIAELEAHSDEMHRELERAERERDEAREDRDNLRGMFESISDELWLNLKDIDWCDWQEEAERRGLLVTVTTADQDFIDEWGSDQMLTWAWSDAACDGEGERDG